MMGFCSRLTASLGDIQLHELTRHPLRYRYIGMIEPNVFTVLIERALFLQEMFPDLITAHERLIKVKDPLPQRSAG